MAVTLVEASKILSGQVVRSGVIEMFARNSDILRVLPLSDVKGGSLAYNVEGELPGVAFRGFNEGYNESTGVVNPQVEALRIAGGDLDVDIALIRTRGQQIRSTQEQMKVKALALNLTKAFIKGDSSSDPREFDGLQNRITGKQVIAAGSTSGGDALSLNKLDELIDQVDSPTHLIMSKAMRRLLTGAARDSNIGGFIAWTKDEFGSQLAMYNDLPILIADYDDTGSRIIDFNEANPGGGSPVGTSIYCVSLQEGMIEGLQNDIMDVRDLGEIDNKPVMRTRVEWLVGLAVMHGRAAARLQGIKNAAVTK